MDAWRDLQLPMTEADARSLRTGDLVRLTGPVFTARDAVHKHLAAGHEPPCDLRGTVLFHCGPVIIRDPASGAWRVTAAGPTTSIREEPYMAEIIRRFGIRGIIGKGGMGEGTLTACREHGCAYFQATGGAAQVLAACIRSVRNVYWLEEFGAPEALWELELKNFPVTVTMDAAGRNLHAEIEATSRLRLDALLAAGPKP